MPVRTLRGFRDLLPDYLEDFRWVEGRARAVFERAGYREVLTPTVEPFELYEEKEGEQIEESMFVFEDKAGRRVALRPEFTASLARLFAAMGGEFKLPVKWYYVGNVFRYDEPQRMRYREFWQAGAELIGASTPESDAEIMSLAWNTLRDVGLGEEALIRLNNVG
ncbi:MAG TPA: histidine--tRNA ligase, partial [Candidatus Korarchaeota archaeon]|nr:histidine--tRNA ligase [Candidatus Korarchaeota archaeon]